MSRTLAGVGLVSLVAALAVAACGGDDTSSSNPSDASSGGTDGGGGTGGNAGGATGGGTATGGIGGDAGTADGAVDATTDAALTGNLTRPVLGVWQGPLKSTVIADYPAWLVLVPGQNGDVVGLTVYPSYPCGGGLTLIDSSTAWLVDGGPVDAMAYDGSPLLQGPGFVFSEKLTWGQTNCGDDGRIVITAAPDGSLNYSWAGSGVVDSGSLSRSAPLGNSVPSAYIGIWRGVITDGTDGGDAGSGGGVIAAITLGSFGNLVGMIAYEALGCAAMWTLGSAANSQLSLTEPTGVGACGSGGSVSLAVSGSNLTYTKTSPGGLVQVGTLSPAVL